MKKLLAVLLVPALILCAFAPGEEAAPLSYLSDFSSDADGWFPRSMGTAEVHIDDGALVITGRESSWNSPGRYFELKPGTEYEISACVKQDREAEAGFMISVAHTKAGIESYENLASAGAAQGEWTRLSCAYTPGSYESYVLYIETVQCGTLSFSVKDFTVKEKTVSYAYDIPSLKEAYAPYFTFGCAATMTEALNTDRMDFYASQFDIITPGNELKPDYVLDIEKSAALAKDDETAAAVRFDYALPLLDYCFAKGISVHGHVLVWHSQTPEAFFHEDYDTGKPFVTREVMLGRLDNYIRLIMEFMNDNYPGLIVSWDVVNEAVDDTTGKLRQSNWTRVVGDDFINRAFEIARRYAPEGTLLFYNDYSTPYEPKLSGILSVLDSLIADGTIDGYGFQCHYDLTTPTVFQLRAALGAVANRGLKIRVSELDVGVAALSDSAYEMQAKRYASLMKEFLAFSDSVTAVQTWGVSDDLSWRVNKNPLLFDKSLQPKPAFYALIDLIQGE